jgi:carboxypeptidase family protein
MVWMGTGAEWMSLIVTRLSSATVRWRQMVVSRPLRLAAVTILLILSPCQHPLAAQTVRVTGIVVDSVSGFPIPAARVVLEPDGVVLSTTVTDSLGTFELIVPLAQKTRITVMAMGMEEWATELGEGANTDLGQVLLRPQPFVLEGFEVSGRSHCEGEPSRLAAGHRIIEAIRPVLRAVEANDRLADTEYVVEIVRTVREYIRWDRVRWRWVPDSVRVRLPFAMPTHSAATLFEEGFAVAVNDSVNEYRAPSPSWLASERLQESHCLLAVEDDAAAPGRAGVRFWPKTPSGLVDLGGTIWLKSEDTPESVDFSYVSTHSSPGLDRSGTCDRPAGARSAGEQRPSRRQQIVLENAWANGRRITNDLRLRAPYGTLRPNWLMTARLRATRRCSARLVVTLYINGPPAQVAWGTPGVHDPSPKGSLE